MLSALMVLLRSIGLICCGHRAVALENLALRQQLAVLRRTGTRPHLRSTDRLFWILLLAHQRRRIVHLNVTEHPTAVWTAQQMIEAFPEDTAR